MKKLLASSLILLLAVAQNALAQNTSEPQRRPGATDNTAAPATTPREGAAPARRNSLGATTPARQGAQGMAMDQGIATCLALGNQAEIAISQFAQQRAENPQVKEFAQTAIEDHQKLLTQLEQAVPQVANWKLEVAGAPGGTRTRTQPAAPGAASTAATETAAAGAQAASPEQQQFLEFGKEMKQECLQLTEAELGRKQGAEFDKCYVAQQIGAHIGMLAELRVAERHVSAQLQPVLQQATQGVEQHLAHAKQLAEQLEQAGGAQASTQARQPATAPAKR